MLIHMSKPQRGKGSCVPEEARPRWWILPNPAETACDFCRVTRVTRTNLPTQTRSRRLQTALLPNYDHHASDV